MHMSNSYNPTSVCLRYVNCKPVLIFRCGLVRNYFT